MQLLTSQITTQEQFISDFLENLNQMLQILKKILNICFLSTCIHREYSSKQYILEIWKKCTTEKPSSNSETHASEFEETLNESVPQEDKRRKYIHTHRHTHINI